MELAHIGFLYKDINTGLKNWKSDKTKILIKKTKDKNLQVYCCLLKFNSLVIELISPMPSNKILIKKLKNNIESKPFGFDHMCFYSKNIDKDLPIWEKKYNSKIVIKKTRSTMFKKNVAFLVLKGGLLIELLEK